MSNQLEKLKNSIKKEYAKSFELNLMKSSGFIPVDKRQTEFFVILNKNCVANKSKIEGLFKEKFAGFTPKFIPVESNDFEALFATLGEVTVAQISAQKEEVKASAEPSAEEMLVGIGWLTSAQLKDCLAESEKRKVPLDLIFKEKELLSYERIVSYLKKKYGCEVVSKSNIVVDPSILKLLPDDFIFKIWNTIYIQRTSCRK